MNSYTKAALLGASAGLRTSVAPLAAKYLTSKRISPANAAGFAVEAALDKTPFVGARTGVGPLGARVGAAAYASRAIDAKQRERIALALVAGGCAIAAAFAGMRLRKSIVERTGAPDWAIALGEDLLALGIAYAAVR